MFGSFKLLYEIVAFDNYFFKIFIFSLIFLCSKGIKVAGKHIIQGRWCSNESISIIDKDIYTVRDKKETLRY